VTRRWNSFVTHLATSNTVYDRCDRRTDRRTLLQTCSDIIILRLLGRNRQVCFTGTVVLVNVGENGWWLALGNCCRRISADRVMGGECFTISRAVFVRMMFTAHGLFSIYRLYVVTQDPNKWYLTTALMGLLMETSITIYRKRGQEWKWSVTLEIFFWLHQPAVRTAVTLTVMPSYDTYRKINDTKKSKNNPVNKHLSQYVLALVAFFCFFTFY